jgi:hypothetical protein
MRALTKRTSRTNPQFAVPFVSVAVTLLLAACGPSKTPGANPFAKSPSGSVSPSAAVGSPVASPSVTTSASASSAPSGLPVQSVNWAAVNYPLDCSPHGARVLQVAYATPEAGRTIAIVLLNCNLGAGTPPDALLTFDGASSSTIPHLAQTLLSISDNWVGQPGSLAVKGADVSFPVGGYPPNEAGGPSYGVSATLSWAWRGGQYHEESAEPPHAMLSSAS